MWITFKEVIRKTVRDLFFSFIGISLGTSENNNSQNIDCVIKFISKLIKWSGASGFDRFLGVMFGLIRGSIVLFVIFLLLPSSIKTTDLINNSKITPIIQKYAPEIEAYFRELIDNRNVVEEALEIIEPLKQEVVPEPISEDTKDGDS